MNSQPGLGNNNSWSSSAWDDYIEAQRDYEVSVQRKSKRNAQLVFHACAVWLYRHGLLLDHEDMRFRPTEPPEESLDDVAPQLDPKQP